MPRNTKQSMKSPATTRKSAFRARTVVAIAMAGMLWHCVASQAVAHPVSVTRTYAYVTPDRVTAKIQVFLEDLFLFHDLKPNDQDFLDPDVIRRGIELHKTFLLQRFVIRDVGGKRLEGRVVAVKDFDVPGEGVALAELMAHTLTFELEYELFAAPEFLTVSQHFTDEEAVIPSEMKLALKQENAGEPHTAELRAGERETVRLSWDNPPLSAEASQQERDAWVAKQKEETLGITSYSSVYSFLYIDDYEVRHEVLIPLLTLEESVLIARDDDDFLDLPEQDAARQQIEAYFTSGNPIEIDGVLATPVVERCDFYGLDFKDFAQRAERRQVGVASARVGIILSYPVKGPPKTLKMTWNRFNQYVWTINLVVFAFEETSKATLARIGGKNVFEWKNLGRASLPEIRSVDAVLPARSMLSVPVASLALLGLIPLSVLAMNVRKRGSRRACLLVSGMLLASAAGAWPLMRWEAPNPLATTPTLPEDVRQDVFGALHHNTYSAFSRRDENAIYDALAMSVDGKLLEELYLRIRRSLEMQEQGGAVSRIREVSLVEGESEPSTDSQVADAHVFAYRCRWNVRGTVEHWGHIHARTNQYEALFTVEPREGSWKITNMELLDEQRVNFETSLRGL
ncbi:MAG: hypothetical protein CMJ48_14220 [Planctomycetaceae bacterium]|nr:hypothetical protein [Planctomycetaceae bacterium]